MLVAAAAAAEPLALDVEGACPDRAALLAALGVPATSEGAPVLAVRVRADASAVRLEARWSGEQAPLVRTLPAAREPCAARAAWVARVVVRYVESIASPAARARRAAATRRAGATRYGVRAAALVRAPQPVAGLRLAFATERGHVAAELSGEAVGERVDAAPPGEVAFREAGARVAGGVALRPGAFVVHALAGVGSRLVFAAARGYDESRPDVRFVPAAGLDLRLGLPTLAGFRVEAALGGEALLARPVYSVDGVGVVARAPAAQATLALGLAWLSGP